MLRVRIKTRPKAHEQNTIRLSKFFAMYFQNMFFELNTVLSDYHSIQEHASRNKIIEFAARKLKDLDLLQIFVKGAGLLKSLSHLKFKGDDCEIYGHRIVEMGDFLGLLYENMKTSFIPVPNFNLALQTQLDYRKLLAAEVYRAVDEGGRRFPFMADADQQTITDADLAHIHRMMRIYLLRENIADFTIEGDVLVIRSKFFTFELALCGHFQNPQWLLFKVKSHTGCRKTDDELMGRLTSLELIVRFVKFFENRKKALEVFNLLETKTGFYQSFTGSSGSADCKGHFKGNNFYCTIASEGELKEFRNVGADEVKEYLKSISTKSVKGDLDVSLASRTAVTFRPDVFGPNYACLHRDMFFCLRKSLNVCLFGKALPVRGYAYQVLYLERIGSEIVGTTNGADAQVAHSITIGEFTDFVNRNLDFLTVLHAVRDLKISCTVNRAVISQSFFIDSSLRLFYIDRNKVNIPINLTDSTLKSALLADMASVIRVISLQEALQHTQIIECQPGRHIKFSLLNIVVDVSDTVETSIKALTEDLQRLRLELVPAYISRFGVFYANNLIPTICTERTLYFDFTNFVGEVIEISAERGVFVINGARTLQISKLSATFTADDMKVFHILHKIFLTDRFIFLKKNFEDPSRKLGSDEIYLDEHRRIQLTQEGIKFKSNNPQADAALTRALNFERNIVHYFSKT